MKEKTYLTALMILERNSKNLDKTLWLQKINSASTKTGCLLYRKTVYGQKFLISTIKKKKIFVLVFFEAQGVKKVDLGSATICIFSQIKQKRNFLPQSLVTFWTKHCGVGILK